MKKMVIVTLACLIAGIFLAAPAFATGYHEVYQQVGGIWVPIGPPGQGGHHAEMFSSSPDVENQYQFNSQAGWKVGGQVYLPPIASDPLIKYIQNEVHLFPWIIVSLNETDLQWDIFKPGEYMSKGPVISIQANTPVNAFAGAFQTPTGPRIPSYLSGPTTALAVPNIFNPGTRKIDYETYGQGSHLDDTQPLSDKIRVGSLLKDAELWNGDELSPGTSPDTIEMYWWGMQAQTAECDEPLVVTSPEMRMVPGPGSDDWYSVAELSDPEAVLFLPDSVPLHNGICFYTYERLVVETCDSEGLYRCNFTLFFAPADP